MPKTTTTTTTKVAKENSTKAPKAEKEKSKRPPSAYNLFMQREMPAWKAKNPDAAHKDAFTAVAKMWGESDENPNKGKPKKQAAPKKKKAASAEVEVGEATSD
ncbi:hypothetical protein DL93DRAFT_221802 [Clavulina sp. PMI_390]|nr:hypothetical protein DL93DRAFT_221802 [Clavulina sp. PMI_390]